MKKTIATAVTLLAAITLAGCSGSSPAVDVTSYDDMDALIAAYNSAGGTCEEGNETQMLPGNESYICEDGSYVILMSAENAKQAREEADGSIPNGSSLILGENWSVFSSLPNAEEIASEMGGEIVLGG